LALNGLRADGVKSEAISTQQSAFSQTFSSQLPQERKGEKGIKFSNFLCDLRVLCGETEP
jgi:hypothetical protein